MACEGKLSDYQINIIIKGMALARNILAVKQIQTGDTGQVHRTPATGPATCARVQRIAAPDIDAAEPFKLIRGDPDAAATTTTTYLPKWWGTEER